MTSFSTVLEQVKVKEFKDKLIELLDKGIKALDDTHITMNSEEYIQGKTDYETLRQQYDDFVKNTEDKLNDEVKKLINRSFNELCYFFENTDDDSGIIAKKLASKTQRTFAKELYDKASNNLFCKSLEDAYKMYKIAKQLINDLNKLRHTQSQNENDEYYMTPVRIMPSVTCAVNYEEKIKPKKFPNALCVSGIYPQINLNELVSMKYLRILCLILNNLDTSSTITTFELIQKYMENTQTNLKEHVDNLNISSTELELLIKELTYEINFIIETVNSFKKYVDMRVSERTNIVDALKTTPEDYFMKSMFAKQYITHSDDTT